MLVQGTQGRKISNRSALGVPARHDPSPVRLRSSATTVWGAQRMTLAGPSRRHLRAVSYHWPALWRASATPAVVAACKASG